MEETGNSKVRSNNEALRGAARNLGQGLEMGKNIQLNLLDQDNKLKKALNNNSEVFGDLSLGNSLITDLERKRSRDRMVCKVVVMIGLSIIAVIVTLKFIVRH